MINGKKYSYESIQVTAFGTELAEATGIKYGYTQDVNKTHVLGQRNPVAVTTSNFDPEGSITVTGDQLALIQKRIPKGGLLCDIEPFDITVTYLNFEDELMTDRISQCTFPSMEKEFATGNNHDTIELELAIGKIEMNI